MKKTTVIVRKNIATNAIEPAVGVFKHIGYPRGMGVPGKGGKTTNAEIPEWMFDRELKEMLGR